MKEARDWPEREAGVQELVGSWSAFIRERPMLTSFLYDVDLLPEQIVSMKGAHALDAVCCVYQAAEEGKIPLRAPPPSPKAEERQ